MTENTTRNKAIIIDALTSAYAKRDFTALEQWFSPDYIQHNPFIPGSRAGLRGYVESLPMGRSYEPGRIVAEGDLVMVHGRYSGGDRKTFIAVDIFRFAGDQSSSTGTSCRKKCRRKKQWPATPCLRGRNV